MKICPDKLQGLILGNSGQAFSQEETVFCPPLFLDESVEGTPWYVC